MSPSSSINRFRLFTKSGGRRAFDGFSRTFSKKSSSLEKDSLCMVRRQYRRAFLSQTRGSLFAAENRYRREQTLMRELKLENREKLTTGGLLASSMTVNIGVDVEGIDTPCSKYSHSILGQYVGSEESHSGPCDQKWCFLSNSFRGIPLVIKSAGFSSDLT